MPGTVRRLDALDGTVDSTSSLRSWRCLSPAELEAAVSPSSMVPNSDELIADYTTRSREALATHPPEVVAYGPGPHETLDLWRPALPDGALLAFFHGGYWRALSKRDTAFPAPGFVARGHGYASIDYTLAPAATLDAIVDQARRAVAHLLDHRAELGFERLVVAGHSAGGHLAALTLDQHPDGALAGAVLLAAVVTCEPLVATTKNEPLGLDEASAHRLSPLACVPRRPRTPLVVAYGARDTDLFKQWSLAYALAWAETGGPAPVVVEADGRNHFDLLHDLTDPERPLGRATLSLLERHP